MKVKMEVRGARKLARDIGKIDKDLAKKLRAEVYLPLARDLAARAKAEAPVGPDRPPPRQTRTVRNTAAITDPVRRLEAAQSNIDSKPGRRKRVKKGGTLRRTVRPRASRSSAAVVAGGKRAPYANAVHWGWPKRNIKPNPWIYRIVIRSKEQTFKRFMGSLKKFERDWNNR